jgi:hypothetical protein
MYKNNFKKNLDKNSLLPQDVLVCASPWLRPALLGAAGHQRGPTRGDHARRPRALIARPPAPLHGAGRPIWVKMRI